MTSLHCLREEKETSRRRLLKHCWYWDYCHWYFKGLLWFNCDIVISWFTFQNHCTDCWVILNLYNMYLPPENSSVALIISKSRLSRANTSTLMTPLTKSMPYLPRVLIVVLLLLLLLCKQNIYEHTLCVNLLYLSRLLSRWPTALYSGLQLDLCETFVITTIINMVVVNHSSISRSRYLI